MTSVLRSSHVLLRVAAKRPPRHAQITRRGLILPSLSDFAKAVASAGSGGSGNDNGEDVQTYHERKILPYDRRQLYTLVADIANYPAFIPYCTGARILSSITHPQTLRNTSGEPVPLPNTREGGEEEMECDAELEVGFLGVKERYISRVIGRPYESVQATATSQIPLFKSLVTTWSFQPASTSSPHPGPTPPTSTPSSPSSASASSSPTLLTIDLAYSFANPLHAVLAQAFFDKVSGKMVEAFERRCLEVYGPGKR